MASPSTVCVKEFENSTMGKVRLGILNTHPIQYQALWFRALAAQSDLDLHVYYCHRATPHEQALAGFRVEFDWDIPLLTGYPHSFLRNTATRPGYGRFAGFDTPEIANIIRSGEYDAVLVNGWHYKSAWQAIWACWKSGVKLLVRGDSHLHTPRSAPKKMAKALIYRAFIPRFDACLAAGEWSREYFLHYGAHPERVFLVPHAVDNEGIAAECRRLEPIRSQLRQHWGLDEDGAVLVFAGKFIEKKRPMDFVHAVEMTARQGVAVQGLMVGDGPLRPTCEDFVRTHRIPIRFTGFLNQSQIVRAYVAGDLLIVPSDGGETWGVVVNEGMACGRPCIVSDAVGCGPDLVRQGQTGESYPVGDIDSLTALIVELVSYPSRLHTMGAHARDRVKQYSVQAAVDGLLGCLLADSRVNHAVVD
jgi:glycosyltransferase involved in cell wall biosynthesis